MWTNWSGGQQGHPVATVRPLDETGVRAAVRRAAGRGHRLRPVGAGHSFSPLAVTDEVALELSALTGVVRCDGDRVRARAGTTLAELNTALTERGLSLAAFGDIDTPTLAGAVATGMHGSSAATGSLSAQVTGVRLIDGTGAAVEVGAAELDAARTGLGAIGVVTEVELSVRPQYVLRLTQDRLPLAEALSREFLDGHAWAEFWVFPYAGHALTRYADEVSEPEPPTRAGTVRSLERRLVRSAAVGGGVALGRTVPKLVPALNRAATRLARSSSVTGEITDLAHRALLARPVVRWEESEWALPRAALADGVRSLLDAIATAGLEVGFPLEVRVGPAETGWLHPAYGRDTGWVAVHIAAGTDPEPLSRLVTEVLGAHGGRPHWAKRHPWTNDEVAAAYPKLAEFRAVRDRHDPHRVFASPYLDSLLGT
ncbi:MAG: FAD-binding protein [Pseudonocardiales bacterium]|nr:FAD-binding protein [Pseudonocardiales bacterium]